MLVFFAIDHADAGMDQSLLECYSDLPAREAALAFGEDYELSRVDAFWPVRGAEQVFENDVIKDALRKKW